MTIQPTLLTIQVSGASAQTASNTERQNNEARGQSSFQSTLAREMAQRQPTPPAPSAPAPTRPAPQNNVAAPPQRAPASQAPATPKPEQASASAAPAATQAAAKSEAPATPDGSVAEQTAPEGAATEAGAEADTEVIDPALVAAGPELEVEVSNEAQDSQALAAASAPVNEMLALMASLTQAPARASGAPAPVAGVTRAAGSGVDPDASADALGVAAQAGLAADQDAGEQPGAMRVPAQLAAETGDSAPRAQLAPGAGSNQSSNFVAALGAAARSASASTPGAQHDEQASALQAVRGAPTLAQVQAQVSSTGAALAAGAMDRIPARVGSQGWDNQLGQRIVYMVGKEQAATLTLNPPDLGPLQIVLSVSNEQASVAFSANQLEVRQALENALPRLREMFSESGLSLEQATVDAGASNQGQPGQSQHAARAGSANGAVGSEADDAMPAEPAPRATRTVAIGEHGTVDLFA